MFSLTKLKKNKSFITKIKKTKRAICENFKKDIIGKPTPKLYKSCLVNSTCRKTKCKDVDKRIYSSRFKKFGMDYNKIVFEMIKNCSNDLSTKSRKRCVNKILEKFHNDNNLGDIYKEYIECDKKLCNKEKEIFYTNLIRQKKIRYKKVKDLKNEVDMNNIKPEPLKSV